MQANSAHKLLSDYIIKLVTSSSRIILKIYALRMLFLLIFLCNYSFLSYASSTHFFTVNEGLSINEVRGIYQDKGMQYIWIYTQNGINRYNGHSIKKLYIERDSLKANNFINDIIEDKHNNLWIASNKGIAIYNYISNQWTQVPTKLQSGKYTHLSFINDTLIYGVKNNSLIQIAAKGKSFTLNHIPIQAKSITDIAAINEDLIIGSSNGLFRFKPKEHKTEKILADIGFCNQLKWLAKDSALWIKQQNNSYIIPIIKGKLNTFNIKDYHQLLFEQTGINYKIGDVVFRDNKYWFATQNGLVSIDKFSNHVETKEHLNFWMNSLLFDNAENLWCGTWQKGVIKVANKSELFTSYRNTKGKRETPLELISSITELDKNKIALATETTGLVVFNRETKQFNIYNGSNTHKYSPFFVQGDIMHCTATDWEGRIWGGYYNEGFNIISGKNKGDLNKIINEYLTQNNPISCDDFYFDHENKQVYIASTEGVLLFDLKSKEIATLIKSKNVSALFKDSLGNLWVGTKNGLTIYNTKSGSKNSKLEEKAKLSGVFSDGITCFYSDNSNYIWIGTYGDGLYKYKIGEPVFEQIQFPEHIDFKVVYSAIEDNTGKIWLGTNSGLVAYDYTNKQFYRYNKSDGIQDNQFNYNAVAKTEDGNIFIGGMNGFTFFNPSNIKDKIEIPSPVISDITIGDDRFNGNQLPSELTIPYTKNSFEISFFTPDYTSSENYIFKYFLDGYSTKERLCPQNSPNVYFSDIPPGRYTLKLWVTLPNSEWSAVTKSPEIIILPPWYKSSMAYFIYIFVLLALFFTAIYISRKHTLFKSSLELANLEKKQAEQINQSKLQFFTDIAHEIRTPLTLILGPIKDIFSNRKLDKELQNSLILVHKSAFKLKVLMDELLLFRKAENGTLPLILKEDNLSELIQKTCDSYQYELSLKNINLEYSSKSAILAVYDKDKLDKVLSNLVSNAIKFTPENGTITILANNDENGFFFSVQDTGIGISEDEINTIFNRFYQSATNKEQGFGIGLALSEKIIEAHNGKLTVKSSTDKGSIFTVRIPQLTPNNQIKEKQEDIAAAEIKFQNTENEPHQITIKGNILIVEDNTDIQKYIATIFNKEYNVTIKSNGKEGFDYAVANIPDIIITDYQMPEMDGITMCKKLKEELNTSHIPIILLSAYNEIEEQIEGLQSGANDYIGKPFHREILLQKVGNILQSRKQLILSFKDGSNIDLSKFEIQDQRFLDKLNKLILKEMSNESFGVPTLCKGLGISKTTLNNKLRKMLDISTADYIKKTRLKEAYTLLTEKNLSPSEAAYAIGFSPTYFTSCFKKEYGVPPGKV